MQQSFIRQSRLAMAILLSLPLGSALTAAAPGDGWPAPLPIDSVKAPHSSAAHENMVAIPAGEYLIGDDSGVLDQRPQHRVTLAAFRLDRTEVTNAAFAEFLNALPVEILATASAGEVESRHFASHGNAFVEGGEGSGRYPIIALDDSQARIGLETGHFAVTEGFEHHPVTESTWAGAAAYCAWRGGRLPTEAEWEAAARYPDGRRYPWGEAPPNEVRVYLSSRSGDTAEVGSRPAGASALGLLDLSGSLAEWTSSLKAPYPYNPADGREEASAPGERVTRGGDYIFDDRPATLTTTHRNGFSNRPSRGHRHIGFRCAASPLATARLPVRACPADGACPLKGLQRAMNRLSDGDTLWLAPGRYREAAILRANNITIKAPGAHLQGVAVGGKAALVIKGNDTLIEDLECSQIAVPDRNGACIRFEGHNLHLRRVYFHDAEQGLLGGGGVVLIEDSRFERLGRGGLAHGIYINRGDAFILRRSQVLAAKDQGHEVKSRAARTLIEDSIIASLASDDSRLIDIPNGGQVLIRRNVLQQGKGSVNWDLIGLGLEGVSYPNSSASIVANLVLIDTVRYRLVRSAIDYVFIDNTLVGGAPVDADNHWFPDRAAARLALYPHLPRPAGQEGATNDVNGPFPPR